MEYSMPNYDENNTKVTEYTVTHYACVACGCAGLTTVFKECPECDRKINWDDIIREENNKQ